MPVVWVPSLLRNLTGGAEKVTVSGTTLRQAINNLEALYPGFKDKVMDEEGRILPSIAVAIDGVTNHLGLIQPIQEETEIHFIPAIGGG